MVQKPTPPVARRGRPPKFVRDDVIDAAVELFWRKGVDHVTLDDLEAATGVDRSTLYNSFDGKAGLYREAAARYVDRTTDRILEPLGTVDDGIEAAAQMIERLRDANIAGDLPSGCFIVNDLASPTIDAAAAERYHANLTAGVRTALTRAAHDGDLDEATADQLAKVTIAGILGANLTSRAIGRADAIDTLDALASLLRNSRVRTRAD